MNISERKGNVPYFWHVAHFSSNKAAHGEVQVLVDVLRVGEFLNVRRQFFLIIHNSALSLALEFVRYLIREIREFGGNIHIITIISCCTKNNFSC